MLIYHVAILFLFILLIWFICRRRTFRKLGGAFIVIVGLSLSLTTCAGGDFTYFVAFELWQLGLVDDIPRASDNPFLYIFFGLLFLVAVIIGIFCLAEGIGEPIGTSWWQEWLWKKQRKKQEKIKKKLEAEKARLYRIRIEAEKAERERLEMERIEQARLEKIRIEEERAEQARLEREEAEKLRIVDARKTSTGAIGVSQTGEIIRDRAG